ncbi:MAG: thioredoxin fold domain-containing protein [Bacteroidota bacterium]
MMPRTLFILVWVAFLLGGCSGQKNAPATTTSLNTVAFSQVDSLIRVEPRPVAVFLHAEWCRFCRSMEQTTFRDPEVIQRLNRDYYFVSFDGEQEAPVEFAGKVFTFRPSGRNSGTHELALQLGTFDGDFAYPTFVLLSPGYEINFQHRAYLDARAMRTVLAKGAE